MSVIKAIDLAYVRVRAPDFDQARLFLADFGLIENSRDGERLGFRGLGPEPEILTVEPGGRGLVAIGFAAGARDDLERFAQAANSRVTERMGRGGGWQVVVHDPDGNQIELIWGVTPVEPVAVDRPHTNEGSDRYRRQGSVRRPASGPAHVLRLGHVVLTTPQPEPLAQWYRDMFGFLVSDVVYDGSEDNVLLSFNRLDLGDEYVDHHVFQTMIGPPRGIHHISFEVLDIDDLYIGHQFLTERGYRHMWGVGRHKQGSQIFDYWIDPSGVMYEHWTDTDLLNADWTPGIESAAASQGPWGPPMPAEFITQVG
ncbi:VOC family protein [Sphingobium sp. Sx8-8]|uniref:VOC family protein n=1 Tax=Sphingobium sp. Sx8-8 TaxID=2933617 RepID=UPI001F567230|nr:VOC family protein [Sphingobium sp. Sx8-8]